MADQPREGYLIGFDVNRTRHSAAQFAIAHCAIEQLQSTYLPTSRAACLCLPTRSPSLPILSALKLAPNSGPSRDTCLRDAVTRPGST